MLALTFNQVEISEKTYQAAKEVIESLQLDIPVEYEYLPEKTEQLPQLSFQSRYSDEPEKIYLDGRYLAKFGFEIVLRKPLGESSDEETAIEILQRIANKLVDSLLDIGEDYRIVKVEKRSSPSLSDQEETWVDYRVTLSVKYQSHL